MIARGPLRRLQQLGLPRGGGGCPSAGRAPWVASSVCCPFCLRVKSRLVPVVSHTPRCGNESKLIGVAASFTVAKNSTDGGGPRCLDIYVRAAVSDWQGRSAGGSCGAGCEPGVRHTPVGTTRDDLCPGGAGRPLGRYIGLRVSGFQEVLCSQTLEVSLVSNDRTVSDRRPSNRMKRCRPPLWERLLEHFEIYFYVVAFLLYVTGTISPRRLRTALGAICPLWYKT